MATLIALLVCLIPTTIGALLSAIGIAGMDRVTRFNVLAMSGKAVEAAGDIDTLLLDKTGTITFGNRMAFEFIAVGGHTEREVAEAAMMSSVADTTPEGKSIVTLAEKKGVTASAMASTARAHSLHRRDPHERHVHEWPQDHEGRGGCHRGIGGHRAAGPDRRKPTASAAKAAHRWRSRITAKSWAWCTSRTPSSPA